MKKNKQLIKYQSGIDSIKYQTPQGQFATGATYEEMPTPSNKPVVEKETKTATKSAPVEFKPSRILGDNRAQEMATVGIMSAIGEMFPSKGKLGVIGKGLKGLLKYGPATVRNVSDLILEASQKGIDNINWGDRLANLSQDIAAGTAGSGAIRFAKNTSKNIKQQINTAANKNPEKDIIEPISC